MTAPEQRCGEDTDLNLFPVLRHHEEQRSYPRVGYRTGVILTTSNHQVLNLVTRNISAEGMQLRSDGNTAMAIHPRGTHIAPGAGPVVTLRMELPTRDGMKPFAAQAQVVYITARAADHIAFGVTYERLRFEDKRTLAEFIMESMRPAPD